MNRPNAKTSQSDANIALVQQMEDSFVAGNMDYVLSVLADDIVVHEAPGVPYPGDHRGREGFLNLAQAFNECWDVQTELDLELLPAGDDRVLALIRFDVIAKTTGKSLTLRMAEVHTIRDGKIADILVHYWDTHAMTEATNGAKWLVGEQA
jgi:uncharacterized protein